MRARLNSININQEFQFICDERMAKKIGRVISLNGGEIITIRTTSDGTIITVQKTVNSFPPLLQSTR